ncbi:MAG: VOC family protein [Variovorax sp.]
MKVQNYLFFDGRCQEALAFYADVLGAKTTMLMRVKDSPDPLPPEMCPPGSEDNVLHAEFNVGETTLMASDGQGGHKPEFKGFALSLDAKDADDAKRLYDALGDGGAVLMPLGKTFFSPCFGMVADRFGVSWMVIVNP